MHKYLIALSFLSFVACSTEYQTTEATITDLEIVNSNNMESHYLVTIEYTVDGTKYSDQFKVYQNKTVEDDLSTPHPGIKFDILYNPSNPMYNKIDYQVKAIRSNT